MPSCPARLTQIALAALLAFAGDAHAEEPLIMGVYSSEPNCASGVEEFSERWSYLHDGGVDEFEAGCFFVEKFVDTSWADQVDGAPDVFPNFIAVGYCQEPGFATPHLFQVRRFGALADGRFTLMLSYQDGAHTNETEYFPCAAAN